MPFTPHRFKEWFNAECFLHGIKTALACLLGFSLIKIIHFGADQWLVITIVVVMCAQMNVGSVIQKSYMRFLGTLLGSFMAALSLSLLGDTLPAIMLGLGIAMLFFSYIATSQEGFAEAGTLGAVTSTIILITPNPTVSIALERCVEISAGILIAALVSQLILPIRARKHLRLNQAEIIRQLRHFYLSTLLADENEEERPHYRELDDLISKSLVAQRKLYKEVRREPSGEHFNKKQFNQYLWCEKEMLRSINLMHHVYKDSSFSKKLFSSDEMTQQFHTVICDALEKISLHLEKKSKEKLPPLLPDINILKHAMNNTAVYSTQNDMMYANAFLFCAENLVTHLNKLLLFIYPAN